jgi:hypothetical protein
MDLGPLDLGEEQGGQCGRALFNFKSKTGKRIGLAIDEMDGGPL